MSYPAEKLPDHYQDLLETCKTIATSYYYLGKLDQACAILKHAVEINQLDTDSIGLDFDLLMMYAERRVQQINMSTGDFEEIHNFAEATLEKAQNPLQKGKALNLLADIYYWQSMNTQGDFLKPRDYSEQSYALLKDENDPEALFWPVFRIGLTHQFRQEYDDALSFFQQADAIARENNFELHISFSARHLGYVLQVQKKYDEALPYLQESLDLRKKLGFKIYLPLAHVLLASFYEDTGDAEQTLQHYEQALEVAKEVGLARTLMITLVNYGLILQKVARYDEARTALNDARPYAEAVGHQHGLKLIADSLAELDKVTTD